jgi:hypothetical protein
LRLAVLGDSCNHLKGGPSDGVSLHLLQLLIVICLKGSHLLQYLDKINDKLFEVFDAEQTVAGIDFDAISDEFGCGLEISVVVLNEGAKFEVVVVALLRELHSGLVVVDAEEIRTDAALNVVRDCLIH